VSKVVRSWRNSSSNPEPAGAGKIYGIAGPITPTIEELTTVAEQEAKKQPEVLRLMPIRVWGFSRR
jgi:hypothetical protein